MKHEKTKIRIRDLGIDVNPPKEVCNDDNCPFHGKVVLRGKTFVGTVTSVDLNKTAKVEWQRSYYLPKYERYEARKSKITAHNPDCINAKKGDIVRVMECRPISKTKNFVIIENLEKKQ